MAFRRTTYVVHCEKCHRFIEKELREQDQCPEPPTKLIEGAPMVAFGSHKQDRNYPQWAPNLPGNGIVHSWSDYQSKLKKAGQVITGSSEESKVRAKHLKRKQAMFNSRRHLFVDMNKKQAYARKF